MTLARQLRRRHAHLLKALRKRSKTPGPTRILVETMSMPNALASPTWGTGALELLAMAFKSAMGNQNRQCFICCQPWTPERPPVAFVSVSLLDIKSVMGAGLCADCAALDGGMAQRIVDAARRDFGIEDCAVRELAQPGHC